MRQSEDPAFRQLLNRVRDSVFSKYRYVSFAERLFKTVDSEIFNIRAADSQTYSIIRTCIILVSETVSLSNTPKLLTLLKIGAGAKVMLTNDLDVSDRLINEAMNKVLYMDFKRDNPLLGRIFVKFDDPKAGNSGKDLRRHR